MVIRILELFKGTGSVSKIAKRKGYKVLSIDFDAKFKPDILVDIVKWDFEKELKKIRFTPDFIWASPPCNTFSPLSYPLKERDPQTGRAFSKRAKMGTRILNKTIKIVKHFQAKNKRLKWVIENPHGMMRKMPWVKKQQMTSTLYCLYGDKRRKRTDFFNNFNLQLKQETKCNKPTIGVVKVKLCDRYKIPGRLISNIFKQAGLAKTKA